MLYYASEAITRQGEKGSGWTYDIKAVYVVAFTNFVLAGYDGRLRIDVGLTDLERGSIFCDKLRLICLQMPCFTKEREECDNHFERWIYILKNMEILDRMPWAAQNAVFQRLAEVGEVSKLSREERLKYDRALKRYRDTLNAMTGAEQKGIEKGIEKGREEGRAEGRAEGLAEGEAKGRAEEKRDTARKMKQKGLPADLIAEMTGLSLADIEEIG